MISFGFYDSVKHDRRYNALQFSALFDGIIRDGIFMSVGDCFQITAQETPSMKVILGSGRAWFDHSWTWNDNPEPMEIPQSELLLPRIDAIVLETNSTDLVRANSIKVIKGIPDSDPVKPNLIDDGLVHQYPLAYIYVGADVTSIRQADITNMIGTEKTPFVTGILETIDATMLLAQWEDQWLAFKEATESEWSTWFNETTTIKLNEITTWFQKVKGKLTEDAAVSLANSIVELEISTNEFHEDIRDRLTVGDVSFYFDQKDGKYGFNTDPNRGADTFVPFSSGEIDKTQLLEALAHSGLGLTEESTPEEIIVRLANRFPAAQEFIDSISTSYSYVAGGGNHASDTVSQLNGHSLISVMSQYGWSSSAWATQTITTNLKDLTNFEKLVVRGVVSNVGGDKRTTESSIYLVESATDTIKYTLLNKVKSGSYNVEVDLSTHNGNHYLKIVNYENAATIRNTILSASLEH